jgi:hypothetical protein
MLKLLEREIASVDQHLVVLSPPDRAIPASFKRVTVDTDRHQSVLRQVQRLRGDVYLQDGAITKEQLSHDGRHQTAEDDKSWHLAMLDAERRVTGVMWYREHDKPTLQQLRTRHCPLADCGTWRDKLHAAVEFDIARARREGIGYAEVGGWAVAPEKRGTTEGLMLALAVYSLSQLTGGALVLTTATARHASAKMLRRIGGSGLESEGTALPSYYDPQYDCEMELLRFDSRRPSAKYARLVEMLKHSVARAEVVDCRAAATISERHEWIGAASGQIAPLLGGLMTA